MEKQSRDKVILAASELSIGYGNHSVQKNLNFELYEGEVAGLAGRNGKGKSTLLRTIVGLMPPLSGSIKIGGRDIQKITIQERARLVSVVLTQRILLNGVDVRTIIQMGRFPYQNGLFVNSKEDAESAERVMDKLGISDFGDRKMSELSDGEQQKVMIARALAEDTPLMVLDEPTAYLDFYVKREIFELLRIIARDEKKSIFFSSHDLELMKEFADRQMMLE